MDQEREEPLPRDSDPNGFHSFRAYIDREITRDPYRVLFGKRLESPPSTNNSSWTSFSWIFEPKARKADAVLDHQAQEPLSSNQAPTAKQQPQSATSPITPTANTSIPQNSETEAADEYEYDPITMRKVPKMKSNAESTPKEPFLKSLFSEHGVDIPVKPYKPHRVFGYGPKSTSKTSSQGEASDSPKAQFTNSRKSEFSSLMAQSKGNSIDTTAQFTDVLPEQGIEVTPTEPDPDETRSRKSPEPDDNTPLFSGTTYEARSVPSDSLPSSSSDWLSREGFRTAEQASSKKEFDGAAIEIPGTQIQSKLEPSLDRMSVPAAEDTTDSDSARLEPSVDRYVTNISGGSQSRLKAKHNANLQDHKSEEDIDLLRASDVRAATKSARVSKKQLETSKQNTRSQLETDFAKHQSVDSDAHDLTAKNITKTAGQISKSLTNIWNHIKDYPSGIVARTMQSMNAFNDDYKKYVKPSNNSNLTEKLIFKDESLSKTPSIYRSATNIGPKPLHTPSNVEEEENERSSRTERLRAAAEEVKKANEATNAQLSQLAADIKVIYEDECGPISPKLTSPLGGPGVPPPKPEMLQENSKKWAVEDTGLELGVQKVQAQLQAIQKGLDGMELAYEKSAKLRVVIDGTKELRRELHEAGMAIRALESGRPQTIWNTPTASSTNFGKKRMELTDRRAELRKSDQDSGENMRSNANEIDSTEQGPSGSPKEVVPNEVPAPVFTPSESPVWNDEQPPPIESLKDKPLDSTYVVLAQDRSTGKIETSSLNNVPVSLDTSVSPILVLSKLHRASDYLAHFERLEKAGYDLYTGSRNMLIFRKRQPVETREKASSTESSTSTLSTSSITDEAGLSKQAATVLDEIPMEVDPSPGPAAPTAPPSKPSKQPDQVVMKSRVRRQEKVFSGTMRPAEESTKENEYEESSAPSERRGTLWEIFTRGVKRVILVVVGLGGAAYTIGFVAEGIGAQTQIQNGIDDGQVQGPRKRIVMTGQRPGIYSTESSR